MKLMRSIATSRWWRKLFLSGTRKSSATAKCPSPIDMTCSAMTDRNDIAQAIAARIKERETADDLKEVVEDVLPRVEKFLESPEERRLRYFREGIITAASGLGVILFCLVMSFIIHSDRGET